jgi:nitronate monooxygenase
MTGVLDGLFDSLVLPVVAAPMTGVSGPELAAAACAAGIVGAFPAHNAESHEELDAWLTQVGEVRRRAADAGVTPGPIALNVVMRRRDRLAGDLKVAMQHEVPLVIASVGSPESIIAPLHDAGVKVFADVANMRHVEKCMAAGVDGLVVLSGGAGGNTGWVNPFAFVRAVRAVYDGPIALAGGISDGVAVHAAEALGCNLAFMGTMFIATHESRAGEDYKAALVSATLDDVESRVSREGLTVNGLRELAFAAGHTVSGVTDIVSVAERVKRLKAEYVAARSGC